MTNAYVATDSGEIRIEEGSFKIVALDYIERCGELIKELRTKGGEKNLENITLMAIRAIMEGRDVTRCRKAIALGYLKHKIEAAKEANDASTLKGLYSTLTSLQCSRRLSLEEKETLRYLGTMIPRRAYENGYATNS